MAKFETTSSNGIEIMVRYPDGGGLLVVVDGEKGYDSAGIKNAFQRWFVEQALLSNLAVGVTDASDLEPHPEPDTGAFVDRIENTYPIPQKAADELDVSIHSTSIADTPKGKGKTIRGVVGTAGDAEK